MPIARPAGLAVLALLAAGAAACSGGSPGPRPGPPGPVSALAVNTGDGALSVGWEAPSSDGGAPVQGYEVQVRPALPAGSVTVSGRTALLAAAANGTPYTVSVAARNAAGTGPAGEARAAPRAYDPGPEAPLSIAGDDSPNGIFDPSVVAVGPAAWMAYSSVDYHLDGGHRVLDVGLRLARSDDGGATWRTVRTVAAPGPALVDDPAAMACGGKQCPGRWNHETSWLVHDPTDAAAPWKLFTHQYFLYPAAAPPASSTVYVLGAIVLWTATSPERLGDEAPRTALRWGLTPASLAGGTDLNALDPALAGCLVAGEGGATARPDALDLVVTCVHGQAGADPLPQKIVLLRSADHGQSFRYVSTLLDPADAALAPGAVFFSAPSLLPGPDPAPVLLATPVLAGGLYGGCAVFPFADPEAGTLMRAGGLPASLLGVPPAAGRFAGACAADRALPALGILKSEVDLSVPWPPTFRIIRNGRGL